jgi:hypothetical protein
MKAGIQPCHKTIGQPLVCLEVDNMPYSKRMGNCYGPVCTAVIDDETFDLIYPFNMTRQVRNGLRERNFFVMAGDLDYEFHFKRFYSI